jgi:acetyltransferase-like isoleucine patch superfamily enzyme
MRIRHWLHVLILPLPSFVKVLLYRTIFGYQVEPGARIGLSLVRAGKCRIGRNARIGHLNWISHVKDLRIGAEVKIGVCNIILGGDQVDIGDAALIGRFNEINSIIDPINTGNADPRLLVGRAAVITAWHKIDYTDRVTIGESAIIAGRHSCLWTHNRQQVRPIEIGRNCYVGSGVQMVPGSRIGPYNVVGLGAVITKTLDVEYHLLAGVPARAVKPLSAEDRAMVEFPTRPDLLDRSTAISS